MLAEKVSAERTSSTAQPWWKGASIYQIYPRSFVDSNGDGIGDLPGITSKLEYVASLGVDAVWLSPFFTSPMRDFGYDVADYCAVDPVFGTLRNLDELLAKAHALGLKVIVDQVYSHSSDQHAWFQESRSSRDNAKADWYVWADAKPDGSPPSNWQSVFGGPAWTWDGRRGQYYLHNFLPEQPDLNLHNPAVQEAILGVARFWLDRGVDGFRLDAINFAMHDPSLRDNPPAPDNGKRTRSFDFQQHRYNQSHPDIVKFLERIRGLLDSYGDRFTVAEVGGDHALAEMQAFTEPGRLNSAYSFDFLYAEKLTPALVAQVARDWPEVAGWPTWAFENHDAPRAISRWASGPNADQLVRTKMLLLATLRGSVIVYQGEELGLPQVDVPFDQLQDPEAIANWPHTLSRDGARTPMPWSSGATNFGFTTGTPWLPVGKEHGILAVDRQQGQPDSTLEFTRQCLALRHAQAALQTGSMEIREAGEALLAFDRLLDSTRLRCTFNLSERSQKFECSGRALLSTGQVDGNSIGAYGAVIEEIA